MSAVLTWYLRQRPLPEISECIPVNRQDLVLIVPEDHPLSDRYTVDLSDTVEYPYIHFKTLGTSPDHRRSL